MTQTDPLRHDALAAVRTVHHVSFRVDDLDASLDFYCGLLGCTPIPRPDLGFRGAWLMAGEVQVHLLECAAEARAGTPPREATPMANHVAFGVADADAYRGYLEGRGVRTATVDGAVAQFWVQDPTGNVIEFIAR